MSFEPSSLLVNLLAGVAAFLATALLLPVVARFARQTGAVDAPDLVRRLHDDHVPRLGGVAVFVGVLAAMTVVFRVPSAGDAVAVWTPFGQHSLAVASGALVVLAVGMLDDMSGLSPLVKLLMQCIAASFVAGAGITIDSVTLWNGGPALELGVVAVPLTLLWIVGVTNAFNLIDGIDGLAVACALVALASLVAADAILEGTRVFLLSSAIVGGLLAFRRVNRHPARMFLGDSGSMTLGFFLAVRSLEAGRTPDGALLVLVPLAALAYPLFDTFTAMARRTALGVAVSRPDRRHVHHQLLARGYTVPSTVRRMTAAMGGVGALAVCAAMLRGAAAAALTAMLSVGVFFVVPLLWQWLGYAELGTPSRFFEQLYQSLRRGIRAVLPVLVAAMVMTVAALVVSPMSAVKPLGAQQGTGGVAPTRSGGSGGVSDAVIRQQLQQSGLTAAQLRARLSAAGYPASLLDRYLDEGAADGGTTPRDVTAALRAIGVDGQVDVDELLRASRADAAQPLSVGAEDAARGAVRDSRTIFGLSLFRSSTSQFFPNLDGPVDANYRLGPGDQLVLILTGDVELVHTLDVAREGFIVIPQVGQLAVANLTLAQLDRLLYDRLSRSYSGIRRDASATTRFSVTVSRLRSNQVFVAGDVRTPGSYRVTSAGTVLTALYAAGGPTNAGSLRRVEVRRGGALVGSLDVYDYLLRGDASRDLRLQQGDVVFVPVAGNRVEVAGAVNRPALYELVPGETLAEVIATAGGLSVTASARRVLIERVLPVDARSDGRDRAVIEVPLLAGGRIPAFAMEGGDVVTVPSVAERLSGRIEVKGHVWYPGAQGLSPALTLSDALARAGGVQPDAYLPVVHIARRNPDGTVTQLAVALRDSTGATDGAVPLREDDEVTVYSRTAFRAERYVVVHGAVAQSGRYAWRSGMTLRDVVLQAGGLAENAWLDSAEVARRPLSNASGTTAVTMRVPLDSSYRIDDGARPTRQDIVLEPFDQVLILQDPTWDVARTVVLTGEVRFPGRYALRSRRETLSEVVSRAGGLKESADASAAYFARLVETASAGRAEQVERRRQAGAAVSDSGQRMPAATTVPPTNSRAIRAELSFQRDTAGRVRVGVDVAAVLRRPQRPDNLVLADGDSLHVPMRQQVISVRGAVNAPTDIAVGAARPLAYYVAAAGGPVERARVRRAYVVQPDGRIESRRYLLWVWRLDPTPRPGATVVVPAKEPAAADRPTVLQSIGVLAQLAATLAAVVAISR